MGEGVVPFPEGITVATVLAGGLAKARALHNQVADETATPLSDVRLLAPLAPASVRDFVAFEEHVEGVSASVDGASHVADEWYEHPTFYFTNPHTILGPGDTLHPPVTERLDFELEVAAVIGGGRANGSNLTEEEAASHIFGYTIMNDWSARDLQAREMKVRLGPAKGKDFGTALGPWIVTADEVDPFVGDDGFLALRAEVFVNGKLVGEDLLSNMGWSFPALVAYASRNSRVLPGDVLGSGTIGNGGCLAELWGRRTEAAPPPLTEGDIVTMSVECLGTLVGTVGTAVEAPPLRRAAPRPRTRRRT
ncbi:fumarylacetoacetate hydrolase family protein [Pseudarthrobacter sp. AG30]|uniref:fumarylacetoacetate hydrolase family protein n=1 Tax=Pseudarthrobacter sp. AG30 TaxID=2249742 RepID=UPI001F0BEC26|nr:fumarylacetoacetate hydrolase family protein [Pseudarthrobacter sp. AG30]